MKSLPSAKLGLKNYVIKSYSLKLTFGFFYIAFAVETRRNKRELGIKEDFENHRENKLDRILYQFNQGFLGKFNLFKFLNEGG
jgi:hypothetical protein